MQLFNIFVMSILPKLFHKFNATVIKILSKEVKIAKGNFEKELGLFEQGGTALPNTKLKLLK